MKKFQFTLDGALRVRQAQLRSAELKLEELVAGEQRLRKSLAAILEERAEAAAYVQQHSADALSLRTLPPYLIGLDLRRATLTHSLENLSASVRAQRELAAALKRSEKLLMKLRERKLAQWQAQAISETESIAQECWLATHRFEK